MSKSSSIKVNVPRPASEFIAHFGDQIDFLQRSCDEYDAGRDSEFRRIAISLRILLHSSSNNRSTSLLKHLGLEEIIFPSYASPIDPRNLLADHCLAMISIDLSGARFAPLLSKGPFPARFLSFKDWWAQPVLKDSEGSTLGRSDFVRTVADQDGGAHVDAAVEEKYHKVVTGVATGLKYQDADGARLILRLERAYLRHIAHEALIATVPQFLRLQGNRVCRCGSERKARYCCLKGKSFEEYLSFFDS